MHTSYSRIAKLEWTQKGPFWHELMTFWELVMPIFDNVGAIWTVYYNTSSV